MPSARPSAPSPSARVALTETGAPSTGAQSAPPWPRCAGPGGACPPRSVQSALAAGEALLGRHAHHLGQEATLSAPSQTGSVSGKCRPRSPRPTAPSTASARAWHTASASLCPPSPARPRSRRRPARAGGGGPRRSGGRRCPGRCARSPSLDASSRSAAPRSSGAVILRLRGSPGTTRTVPPSASTSMASSVAPAPACWWARRSTAASEGLGRLDGDQRARSRVSVTARDRPPP
jgi:hypothetical protein